MAFFKDDAEYQRYLIEKRSSRQRELGILPPEPPVDREIKGLHLPIIDWCNAQWPRVKYIHARTDIPSGIAEGAQDFTLFLPGGRTLCIECKAKDGKLSDEQRIWAKEMDMQGHTVHIVRSMAEFIALVENKTPESSKPDPGATTTPTALRRESSEVSEG